MDIVHPVTGENTGIKITLLSIDSDEYHKVSMRLQNENIKFARKNRGKTTAEKLNSDALDLLVGVTVGWTGITDGANDDPVPFSAENCRKIYTELPFIREQVDEFLGDRRNFIKA